MCVGMDSCGGQEDRCVCAWTRVWAKRTGVCVHGLVWGPGGQGVCMSLPGLLFAWSLCHSLA